MHRNESLRPLRRRHDSEAVGFRVLMGFASPGVCKFAPGENTWIDYYSRGINYGETIIEESGTSRSASPVQQRHVRGFRLAESHAPVVYRRHKAPYRLVRETAPLVEQLERPFLEAGPSRAIHLYDLWLAACC